MFELLDEWKFLAGLGIFLFGMFMMEESIKLLSGRSFKVLIRRYTGTRAKGLLTGIVSTSILQSSSAVSLMVLAFVGAGLMTLANAIAVVIGAKVGTTLTAWIVAVFGFKFKIEAFAMPLIGIGGLGLIFLSKSYRYVNICKLLVAFGFLFHGLDFMKSSVEELAAALDLAALPDLGLWVYLLTGILLTAIMQSSSATIAVVLTTLYTGIIDFQTGAVMVIGANIGTTVTILLGALGGTPAKKQTAVSSLVFSVCTATVVLLLLPAIFWLLLDRLALAGNAVLGVALFHTLFNLIGVVMFYPFIPVLARFLSRLFAEKKTVLTRYIRNTSPEVPEAGIAALSSEILNQLDLSIRFVALHYEIDNSVQAALNKNAKTGAGSNRVVVYDDLERLHAEIFAFYANVQSHKMEEHEAVRMEKLMRSSRSIMNATRNWYESLGLIEDIGNDENEVLVSAHRNLKQRLKQLHAMVEQVVQRPDAATVHGFLASGFNAVEAADKQFIRNCSKSIAQGLIKEQEVTRLLMANRLFTQSSRMLVLSMQGLTQSEDHLDNRFLDGTSVGLSTDRLANTGAGAAGVATDSQVGAGSVSAGNPTALTK